MNKNGETPSIKWLQGALDLREVLKTVKSVTIAGEASPDPDCAGSQLAMRRLCHQVNPGLSIKLLNDQGCPSNLRWLKDAKMLSVPSESEPVADLVIVVDGGIERCGPRTRELVELSPKRALIDHHLVGSSFEYDASIVDAQAASTTEIIFDLAKVWDLAIDQVIADALYLGLVADTGSFQFSSTSAHSLEVAAELVRAGARASLIAEKVRLERPFDFLTFQSRVFGKLKRYHDGRVLVCVADREDIEGLKLGDLPFDQALSSFSFIKGVEVTVMLKGGPTFQKSKPEKSWRRLSFRSRGRINVANLARSLDPQGGGHACASGCLLQGDDEAILQAILDKLTEQFKKG
jgi:bifunctional oligoribonuclease and PAP phosphatase NrnA